MASKLSSGFNGRDTRRLKKLQSTEKSKTSGLNQHEMERKAKARLAISIAIDAKKGKWLQKTCQKQPVIIKMVTSQHLTIKPGRTENARVGATVNKSNNQSKAPIVSWLRIEQRRAIHMH